MLKTNKHGNRKSNVNTLVHNHYIYKWLYYLEHKQKPIKFEFRYMYMRFNQYNNISKFNAQFQMKYQNTSKSWWIEEFEGKWKKEKIEAPSAATICELTQAKKAAIFLPRWKTTTKSCVVGVCMPSIPTRSRFRWRYMFISRLHPSMLASSVAQLFWLPFS